MDIFQRVSIDIFTGGHHQNGVLEQVTLYSQIAERMTGGDADIFQRQDFGVNQQPVHVFIIHSSPEKAEWVA